MDSLFPFGLPGATITYTLLYVVTLAVHAVLVGYVLGGAAHVAITRGLAAVRGRPVVPASRFRGLPACPPCRVQ